MCGQRNYQVVGIKLCNLTGKSNLICLLLSSSLRKDKKVKHDKSATDNPISKLLPFFAASRLTGNLFHHTNILSQLK